MLTLGYCGLKMHKFDHIATSNGGILYNKMMCFQEPIKPSVNAIKLASTASLNDCQLRNVYRYRYIVVIDFDEIVVPRFHSNYSQMIDHIRRKYELPYPAYQYQFVNTYFFTEFEPDMTQPSHLRTLRLRRRAEPSKDGVCYVNDYRAVI